jgi:hypothetical protein
MGVGYPLPVTFRSTIQTIIDDSALFEVRGSTMRELVLVLTMSLRQGLEHDVPKTRAVTVVTWPALHPSRTLISKAPRIGIEDSEKNCHVAYYKSGFVCFIKNCGLRLQCSVYLCSSQFGFFFPNKDSHVFIKQRYHQISIAYCILPSSLRDLVLAFLAFLLTASSPSAPPRLRLRHRRSYSHLRLVQHVHQDRERKGTQRNGSEASRSNSLTTRTCCG